MKTPAFPFQDPRQVRAALREQGESDADIEALAPVVARLEEGIVPVDPASTARLWAQLLSVAPQPSLVRQAVLSRWGSPWAQWLYFLDVARAQLNILQPGFWFFSAGVSILGWLLTASNLHLSHTLLLWLLAPVLAVIGVHYGFQSTRFRVGELEAVCPVSPLRLTLARLVIILCYDTMLLGGLSLVFVRTGIDQSLGSLTLNWLAPLLFVVGLALVLSQPFSLRTAVTIAYALWMVFVVALNSRAALLSSLKVEAGILLLGVGLLVVSLLRQKNSVLQNE